MILASPNLVSNLLCSLPLLDPTNCYNSKGTKKGYCRWLQYWRFIWLSCDTCVVALLGTPKLDCPRSTNSQTDKNVTWKWRQCWHLWISWRTALLPSSATTQPATTQQATKKECFLLPMGPIFALGLTLMWHLWGCCHPRLSHFQLPRDQQLAKQPRKELWWRKYWHLWIRRSISDARATECLDTCNDRWGINRQHTAPFSWTRVSPVKVKASNFSKYNDSFLCHRLGWAEDA
jgi:hypothetical protein